PTPNPTPNPTPFLDLQEEYKLLQSHLTPPLLQTLVQAQYIQGPPVKQLEKQLQYLLRIPHCITTSSGTDALVIALRALALEREKKEFFQPTDEILTTPFSFVASADAILRAGATPVFADIHPQTFNLHPESIQKILRSKHNIKGLLLVHLYGQACEMDEIIKIAQKYQLFIVEDVAQAFGGKWNSQPLGTLGDIAAFSFFPTKNLGAMGDGGMIATHNPNLAHYARMLTKHGGKNKYNSQYLGYNARLDTLQATLLLAKLPFLPTLLQQRRQTAKLYQQYLQHLPQLKLPYVHPSAQHTYHQFTISTPYQQQLQHYLQQHHIPTMIYYPKLLPEMKLFQSKCRTPLPLTAAKQATQQVLSLPISPTQKTQITQQICQHIQNFFHQNT
ncbi:MAG: DegT/DnrJ/EryC1/StrS family aminotransferase, partial [Planctomycetota bacterium]